MRAETKTAVKNSVSRLVFVALSVLTQVLWIMLLVMKINSYSTWVSLFTSVLALVLVLWIYGRDMNANMKMPWIILILTLPVMGVCLYLLCGRSTVTKRMRQNFERIDKELSVFQEQDEDVVDRLEADNEAVARQSYYIRRYASGMLYQNTDVMFYPDASEGIEAQKQALARAEKFIFMEYHAIEDAEAFGEIKEILAKKAKEGVEVRLFYDDVGSIGFINPDFIKRMQQQGIACRVFNPLVPILYIFMNNRDHRKITVVDGKVGFTGGYNLANEYFNITHPYGQWKDTGVRLEGDAVRSLTLMFLEMWNAIEKSDTDYAKYLPQVTYTAKQKGFVQPYCDSPLDGERVGENVYMNIIKNAKRYVYFMTPYLIPSDEMKRELGLAAKRGVDVRIITPGIPDKKLVYKMTRSNYAGLVRDGVRIYEYTPGFCHAKQCVCDDEVATVGTINLDFRSLYLHFENGVFLYDAPAVKEIKQDFEETMQVCREVTEDYRYAGQKVPRIGQCILQLIAPLL